MHAIALWLSLQSMKIKTRDIQSLWRLGNVNGIQPAKRSLSQGFLQLSAGALLKKRLKSLC